MNDDTTKSAEPPDTGPLQRIGPYRLLQKIGEGGMGEVYLAEQEKPIRRRVALKLIKLGMDTKQVVARFESERQALALMNPCCPLTRSSPLGADCTRVCPRIEDL